jgi:predicted kinase
MLVVVVTGPPASGKTTIAARLAAALALPLLTKDGFKERLFDALGADDVDSSRALGPASFAVLWHALDAVLAAGGSAIVEGNVDSAYGGAAIARLRERHAFDVLQIHCAAPVDVLLERYARRERHPGHQDAARLDGIRPRLEAEQYLLPLPEDELIRVDTSREVDLENLIGRIEELQQQKGPSRGPFCCA